MLERSDRLFILLSMLMQPTMRQKVEETIAAAPGEQTTSTREPVEDAADLA